MELIEAIQRLELERDHKRSEADGIASNKTRRYSKELRAFLVREHSADAEAIDVVLAALAGAK